MAKYVCTICGYVYDEAKGIPDDGIAPGTAWADLPEDWLCPLCGATKPAFELQGSQDAVSQTKPVPAMEAAEDLKELSPLELSALCTNLARGCEKQYKAEEATLFTELAEYFKQAAAPAENSDIDQLIAAVEKNLSEGLPNANATASEAGDRGALRALTWSDKVTRIQKSLLARYKKEGDAMLENTGVYVCTICGFIFIGDAPPELCPVCKVANWKFEKVEGR